MIKDKMIAAMKNLAEVEYQESLEEHTMFHSPHEASAVVHEEIEEAQEDMELMLHDYEAMWEDVKENEGVEAEHARNIMLAAMYCACECVQVMAMCTKTIKSTEGEDYEL